MNATQVQTGYQPVHQEEVSTRTMTGGALMQSVGALATLALAIAGLAGVFSTTLAAIAAIVLGAAIWMEGGAFIASHRTEVFGASAGARTIAWGQRLSAEFLGGLSGVILGILALLGVIPLALLPIAALVFGATLLFSGGAGLGSGTQPVFGLAGVTLGLLAICGLDSLTLVLVALMCLGASTLINGAANGLRMTIASER